MGTTGIEYRDIDGIIEAYDNYDKPNFSIWAGSSLKVKYEGGNMDQGKDMLRNFLSQIQQSATTTVYTIRVYPGECDNINNKTPYEGSFTFMLGNRADSYRNEQGVIILPGGQQAPAKNNTAETMQLTERINRLEAELNNEREKRHKAELENIRKEFTNQIAGLQQKEEPNKWLEIGEKLIEKPDGIEKIFNGLGSLIDKFIANREVPPIKLAGTEQKNDTMQHEEETHINSEEELTAEEQDLFDRMDDAIDTIEEKVGTTPLVEALEKIAAMPADKINALLMMM